MAPGARSVAMAFRSMARMVQDQAMKVLVWNVNSIRARHDRALAVVERHAPDVVCLQELKVTDDKFPTEAFEERGYRCALRGQRAYNGVAILSRSEPTDVVRGMGDDAEDEQARLIEATVDGVRVLCAYFPNGSTLDSPKYQYKLEWMSRLRRHLDATYSPDDRLILCGDFNVAVDDADVAFPEKWKDSVLFHRSAREALEEVRGFGFVDVFRKHHPDGGIYSWWDYRRLSFPKGNGLRIDHVFATDPVARTSTGAEIDREERKGESPSDHAPVVATFDV